MGGLMIIQIANRDTDHILVPWVCGVHVYWPDENKKHMHLDHTKSLSKYRSISIIVSSKPTCSNATQPIQ